MAAEVEIRHFEFGLVILGSGFERATILPLKQFAERVSLANSDSDNAPRDCRYAGATILLHGRLEIFGFYP